MPWSNDATIHSLRLAYNAALTAHAGCARALLEASMRGDTPTAALVETERHAKLQLEESRKKLHDAMKRAIAGPLGSEPSLTE